MAKTARILIIEDDDDIREVCRDLLESEGFKVDTCANGKEALAFLATHPDPCLILLDMLMPVMNGREFMEAFSKHPHTLVAIPVYLVSATASGAAGKEMGCLGFLKKPFDSDALVAIVRAHCATNESACTRIPPGDIPASKIPPGSFTPKYRPGPFLGS